LIVNFFSRIWIYNSRLSFDRKNHMQQINHNTTCTKPQNIERENCCSRFNESVSFTTHAPFGRFIGHTLAHKHCKDSYKFLLKKYIYICYVYIRISLNFILFSTHYLLHNYLYNNCSYCVVIVPYTHNSINTQHVQKHCLIITF